MLDLDLIKKQLKTPTCDGNIYEYKKIVRFGAIL